MKCKLCQKESVLRNSHIISEFQYLPLYDAKHRIHVVTKEKIAYIQKGLREKLLCQECETKLSEWENYAKKVIFEEQSRLLISSNLGVKVGGIDYKIFKMYLLSLIWRMGISQLPAFKNVKLGKHEEIMRRMLLTEDPGDADQYPCLLVEVVVDGKAHKDWILPPERIKIDGRFVYRTVISGILHLFYVSSTPFPLPPGEVYLSKSGNMAIFRKELKDIEYLRKYLEDLKSSIL